MGKLTDSMEKEKLKEQEQEQENSVQQGLAAGVNSKNRLTGGESYAKSRREKPR